MADKLELSILVEECAFKTSHYSDTSTFYALRFVTINEKDEVRNPSSSFCDEAFAGFQNLVVRCYLSWHQGQKFSADSWEILYDTCYYIGLREAELYVKTLKRIGKISDKFAVRPLTFGQYVAMVCSALGIKRFVRMRGRERGWHTENDYHFTIVKYLADAVDQSIETARKAKFEPEVLSA